MSAKNSTAAWQWMPASFRKLQQTPDLTAYAVGTLLAPSRVNPGAASGIERSASSGTETD
jgi:hypothetical protein